MHKQQKKLQMKLTKRFTRGAICRNVTKLSKLTIEKEAELAE